MLRSHKQIGKAVGTCSNCGRTHRKDRPADIAYCNCYKKCPQCGATMTPYTPDLTGKHYNVDKGLKVLFVCLECKPPYYSKLLPVEVTLE